MNNKVIVSVVIVLIALAAILYFANNDDDAAETNSQAETMEVGNDQNTGDAMEGGDNTQPDTTTPQNSVVLAPTETGMSVTVSNANLTKSGYVVIYRVNSNNDTAVIGNSDLLTAGAYSDITVSLDSGVAREQTIVAVLHEDDGDGEFEFPGSDGYLGNSGRPVVSDVDVVDIAAEDEDVVLQENVELYLEENLGS